MVNSELVNMQTQLSFQEDTIARLNDVVTRQQGDIVQLLAEVKQLKRICHSLVANHKPDSPVDEVPPHY